MTSGALRYALGVYCTLAGALMLVAPHRLVVASLVQVNTSLAWWGIAHLVAGRTEAVAAIARLPYAAILMDCQMPDLDGYEATGAIRARERASGAGEHARVPIVALTANALAADRDRCLAAGMDEYLAKPLRPQVLATTLERWARVPEPPATPTASSPPSTGLLPSAR